MLHGLQHLSLFELVEILELINNCLHFPSRYPFCHEYENVVPHKTYQVFSLLAIFVFLNEIIPEDTIYTHLLFPTRFEI